MSSDSPSPGSTDAGTACTIYYGEDIRFKRDHCEYPISQPGIQINPVTFLQRYVRIRGTSEILIDTHDLFQYAQRGVLKVSRIIKLRTLMQKPSDLVTEQNHNPLKRKVHMTDPTHESTDEWLAEFKTPLDLDKARKEPSVLIHSSRDLH